MFFCYLQLCCVIKFSYIWELLYIFYHLVLVLFRYSSFRPSLEFRLNGCNSTTNNNINNNNKYSYREFKWRHHSSANRTIIYTCTSFPNNVYSVHPTVWLGVIYYVVAFTVGFLFIFLSSSLIFHLYIHLFNFFLVLIHIYFVLCTKYNNSFFSHAVYFIYIKFYVLQNIYFVWMNKKYWSFDQKTYFRLENNI